MITSLGLKSIRRSKIVKKSKFSITEVSLKDLSKTVEEFKGVTYDGYTRKRYKHMATDSYLYLAIHLEKFMMSNSHGSARTQNMSTQNIII